MRRMWINQPSTLQPLHRMHGVNVLAVEEYKGTMRVYFLSGDVVSQQVFTRCLSPGWRIAGRSNTQPSEG